MAGMYDVVSTLLEQQLREAQQKLKEGKTSNAPDLKALQDAVDKAQAALDKYQKSDGSERKRLNEKYLQQYYDKYGAWVQDLVEQWPTLTSLFSQAVKNNWDVNQFLSHLYETDWWANQAKAGHGSNWLIAYQMEHDPANLPRWTQNLADARSIIQTAAANILRSGVTIDPKELDRLAKMYWYQGWDKNPDQMTHYLQTVVAPKLNNPTQPGTGTGTDTGTTPGVSTGVPASTQSKTAELRALAESYGISIDPASLAEWVTKILDPTINRNGSEDANFRQWLVNSSKERYGAFADQISETTSLRQLTGAYTSTLASLLEMDPTQFKLDQNGMDPLLKQALTNINPETGQPERIPLWKFEQMVRQDDRWQLTDNARQTYMNAGTGFLRALGFVG